ncbi:hypothetical protein D9757_008213 [Collybiopsis confluens]|uniref:pH-response regulator protein palC n=1 Tax=Collybiopsis confluens TaxID=2823264 RepID=A0A8H5HC17_9AGAR|nr:hypothetical protein D9757_008213 [Collybiopsis confluens]
MTTFLYELSTTGAVSFTDILKDPNGSYTRRISDATQARSRLRGILKENKRADGEQDYLTIIKVIDGYLPQLQGIIDCVAHGELQLKSEPVVFSWRTTLSASLFNNSPRISLPSLHAEYACCLLNYAFAYSNLARTIVSSLGSYEHDRAISEAERETKDTRLTHAVRHLGRASEIFTYLSETVLPELHQVAGSNKLPPDLSIEVNAALAKLSLADAQTVAIRKLLSKSFYDSNVTPGPPLPKSHPLPGVVAKLHLECASLYSSARTLAKTPSASKSSDDVPAELRHYLAAEASLHAALAKKWLGIDAGEKGGEKRAGDAVAFLAWSKKEFQELRDGGKGPGLAKGEKEKRDRNLRKEKVAAELGSVEVWLKHYKNVNDTVHFQAIPAQADLQSRIPSGMSALATTVSIYIPYKPVFGPLSDARITNGQPLHDANPASSPDDTSQSGASARESSAYAGAGEYY